MIPIVNKIYRIMRVVLLPGFFDSSQEVFLLWRRKNSHLLTLLLLLLHLFNCVFSRTALVSQYQKGKTSLDLNEARNDGGVF